MARNFFSRFTRSMPPEPTAEVMRKITRQGLQVAARKAAVSLRVDADVLDWFKSQGAGYQTRINAVLKAYKEAAGQA